MSRPSTTTAHTRRSFFGFLLQDQCDTGSSRTSYLLAVGRSFVSVRHFAVTVFRLSQATGRLWPAAATALKQLNHVVTGADLAWQCTVGPGLVLHHPTGVVWGAGTAIGARCRVQQGVTIGGRGGTDADGSPRIGHNVILGAGCRVLGAVVVGDGAIIGANAVVLQDVPSGRTAVGVPARVLGTRASQRSMDNG